MAQVIADRVKESTVSTGTGALTLAGAAVGYQAFSAVCSVNDTVYYAIEAVDSNGVATGAWEVGLGTYSAANTLTRTTPQASSNGGAAVNFAAGTKGVWIDLTATEIGLYALTSSLGTFATQNFLTPPAIGGTAPAAGSFNPLNIGAAGTQVTLQCDVANQVSQRNGANAQVFLSYNTFTDGSNYERGSVGWSGSTFTISTGNAGTGAARNMAVGPAGAANMFLQTNGTTRWTVGATTLLANPDDTIDIGSSGAGRPKQLFLGHAIRQIGGITTVGVVGCPAIVATGRVTAQSAANASISTFTVGAADASFEVSGNMNVTVSTTLATTLTCTYTDESNTARSMILPIAPLSGTFTAAGAISGAGASVWHTSVMHIRCKAATVITILTSAGTFTGVTYTAEGIIKQTA